jgi:ABC-type multidrug transport system ATPase subunit
METVTAEGGAADSGHSLGLEVVGLTKRFKHHLAVDDISFSIPKDECFALLGPNGAGKTTCISMIRGETSPSTPGGDVLVEGISALQGNRAKARAKTGVCPQIDALDKMTVLEHLHFYARVRGVAKPQYNIDTLLDSLGLRQYSSRMAESLSGGNKRKLSLGIALMGNPTVLLLDEPSSGMDAASMRLMWRILSSVTPGRSLLLTTHSMEEADALATRAGVVAGRMLVSGKTEELRRRHGDRDFVHLVHKDGAHTSDAAMTMIKRWVQTWFPTARLPENGSAHGQVRFELPRITSNGLEIQLASVFEKIENGKQRIGVQYYSVNRATLEQVFLGVLETFEYNRER